VVVLDVVIEDVLVLVLRIVLVSFADFVKDGDADDVLERAGDNDKVGLELWVLLLGAVLLRVGEEDDVFDNAAEVVVVLLEVDVFVPVADPVFVLVVKLLVEDKGDEDEVFEIELVLVVVMVEVWVLVVVDEGDTRRVGTADLVKVVVLVDVLLAVVLILGKNTIPSNFLAFSKLGDMNVEFCDEISILLFINNKAKIIFFNIYINIYNNFSLNFKNLLLLDFWN